MIYWCKRGLFVGVLVFVPTLHAGDEGEIKLKFADCPASVQKTLAREAHGATIETVEKEIDDGKTIYEAEFKIDGKTYSATIAENGTLLEKVLDDDSDEGEKSDTDTWLKEFPVDKAKLAPTGNNPFFILEPGHVSHFEGGGEKLTITVLSETRLVDGVTTRIVEEREEKDGKLIEVSRNYFAIDKTNSSVYYFGEDVDIYKNGKIINHDGSWLSGKDGASFGMMMPGNPKVGDKFFQELAPKTAMDRCNIIERISEFKTPAGTFKNCLRFKDTSPLEKGASDKVYAMGVGLVKDDELLLTKTSSNKE